MALAVVRVVESAVTVSVAGSELLGPLVSAATAAKTAAEAAQAAAETAEVDAEAAAETLNDRLSMFARFPDLTRSIVFSARDGDDVLREYGYISTDGELDIDQTEVRIPGWTIQDRMRLSAEDGRVPVMSSDGGFYGWLTPTYDGDEAESDAYASQTYNGARLWQTRDRLTRLLLGEAAQLVIANIGDSWTATEQRYVEPVAEYLTDTYGDAGGGWQGFGLTSAVPNGGARNTYTVTHSGTWVETTDTNPSPDLRYSTSSTPGDKFTVTGPALPVLSAVTLFWIGTADGVVEYSWNGGAATSLNVQGTVGALESADLSANMPASGVWTLEIEVVSGTVSLAGVDVKSAASGVRVHKLGNSGATTSRFLTADATQWQEGLTALDPDLVTILLGTNERAAGTSPDAMATNIGSLIDRVQAACPAADVLVIMPCEAPASGAYDMSEYAAAVFDVAVDRGAAWLNLQPVFGDAAADYADGSSRPLFVSDAIHPTNDQRVIAGALIRLLTTA